MKKILDPGKDVFKITCQRCLCKFEYTLEDLQPAGDSIEYVVCPWCGAAVPHKPEYGR